MNAESKLRWWLLLFSCLAPFLFFIVSAIQVVALNPMALGADPGEVLTHWLGHTGLVFLLITLVCRPLALEVRALRWVIHYRRMLGLSAAFYVTLHLLAYSLFILQLQWLQITSEVIKRPYLLLGFVAWALLIPLVITSHGDIRKALGGRRWRNLHRLVYLVAILAVIHYLLQVRSDALLAMVYGLSLAILFVYRLNKSRT